jgi:hypothetical protein
MRSLNTLHGCHTFLASVDVTQANGVNFENRHKKRTDKSGGDEGFSERAARLKLRGARKYHCLKIAADCMPFFELSCSRRKME